MHNKPSVSVSRDRPFRNTAKIGHDRPKQAVTPYRNDRSRLTETTGHALPKWAVTMDRNTQVDTDKKAFVLLDRQENAGNTFKLGDGSVTFKCEK